MISIPLTLAEEDELRQYPINARALWAAVFLQALYDAKTTHETSSPTMLTDIGSLRVGRCLHCQARRWLLRVGRLADVGDCAMVRDVLGWDALDLSTLRKWLDDPDTIRELFGKQFIEVDYIKEMPQGLPFAGLPPWFRHTDGGYTPTGPIPSTRTSCRWCTWSFPGNQQTMLRMHVSRAHSDKWKQYKEMWKGRRWEGIEYRESEGLERRYSLKQFRPRRRRRSHGRDA